VHKLCIKPAGHRVIVASTIFYSIAAMHICRYLRKHVYIYIYTYACIHNDI